MNNNKKILYKLLTLYVSNIINAKTFSEKYIDSYNFLSNTDFTPEEFSFFSELTHFIHLLSPSESEFSRYPELYISEKQLKDIAYKINKRLRYYYIQYNIGLPCFFCDKPVISSHIDPCRMHVKIPLKEGLQCHQYFFCHVACVEKKATRKAYFDLSYLGNDEEEGEDKE